MKLTKKWLKENSIKFTVKNCNLTVGGDLDLRGTQISSLPDNLTVGGDLDLRGTQTSSLPDNLTTGMNVIEQLLALVPLKRNNLLKKNNQKTKWH